MNWEYKRLDLSDPPHGTTDMDMLNEAGYAGWELVALTANHVAILKRQVAASPGRVASTQRARSRSAVPPKEPDA